ncbi:MAG: MBL fold metallo-hydrolase [Candidatus Komeilibacteria bacterium]
MTIKKLGHCCLLIKEAGLTILTDPGAYSPSQVEVTGVDVILISHDHQDHLHVESLEIILKNNPQAIIYTNKGVGKVLSDKGITFNLLEDGQSVVIKEVEISGHGTEHELIYPGLLRANNTGYFIGTRLFYPGDAFTNPGKVVEVLALPVAGPWLTIGNAIDYAKQIKPKIAFPVHDGMFAPGRGSFAHRIPRPILEAVGINFIPLIEGQEIEL